ncbi:Coiled-coil domain-containing protein 77 [Trichoplax sp. H2]|nr:Coiled-coil domain-containing protein 77 [Trichoplax sp. H2]|eukprot:RDD47248.1 Coiled-coil domain-containing protein 77 [Trichoplax sp. H2]
MDPHPLTSDPDYNKTNEIIPSVNERLGQLRPSKELLEYYRRKITEYDSEQEELAKKLNSFKNLFEEQHKLQSELRQREEEITELQQALSDMQVYLFREREHVLQIYSENSRLKLQEMADRKKIQELLALVNSSDNLESTYFYKTLPDNIVIRKTNSPTELNLDKSVSDHRDRQSLNVRPISNRKYSDKGRDSIAKEESTSCVDVETLFLQIESLQAELEEYKKLSKDRITVLLEDRNVRVEEQKATQKRASDNIQLLSDKLQKTQSLLYESTKDFLELKYTTKLKEREWMFNKDNMLQELELLRFEIQNKTTSPMSTVLTANPKVTESDTAKQHLLATHFLREQLTQVQKLADMYREQCINFEDELCKLREQEDASQQAFHERTEKLRKRLALMNQRYLALEQRRVLEVEGFKNDIKTLRNRLQDVEKQILKVTAGTADDREFRFLKDIQLNAGKSKMILETLKELKVKMYSLESELRKT